MEPQKKKKFKLFDLYRDGKGVEKEEAGPPNLKNFFKLFGRKFTRLLSLNLYMLLEFLPLVLILYLFFTGEKTPSVTSPLYPALWGASQVVQSPVLAPLFALNGIQFQLPFISPWLCSDHHWDCHRLATDLWLSERWHHLCPAQHGAQRGGLHVERLLVRHPSQQEAGPTDGHH